MLIAFFSFAIHCQETLLAADCTDKLVQIHSDVTTINFSEENNIVLLYGDIAKANFTVITKKNTSFRCGDSMINKYGYYFREKDVKLLIEKTQNSDLSVCVVNKIYGRSNGKITFISSLPKSANNIFKLYRCLPFEMHPMYIFLKETMEEDYNTISSFNVKMMILKEPFIDDKPWLLYLLIGLIALGFVFFAIYIYMEINSKKKGWTLFFYILTLLCIIPGVFAYIWWKNYSKINSISSEHAETSSENASASPENSATSPENAATSPENAPKTSHDIHTILAVIFLFLSGIAFAFLVIYAFPYKAWEFSENKLTAYIFYPVTFVSGYAVNIGKGLGAAVRFFDSKQLSCCVSKKCTSCFRTLLFRLRLGFVSVIQDNSVLFASTMILVLSTGVKHLMAKSFFFWASVYYYFIGLVSLLANLLTFGFRKQIFYKKTCNNELIEKVALTVENQEDVEVSKIDQIRTFTFGEEEESLAYQALKNGESWLYVLTAKRTMFDIQSVPDISFGQVGGSYATAAFLRFIFGSFYIRDQLLKIPSHSIIMQRREFKHFCIFGEILGELYRRAEDMDYIPKKLKELPGFDDNNPIGNVYRAMKSIFFNNKEIIGQCITEYNDGKIPQIEQHHDAILLTYFDGTFVVYYRINSDEWKLFHNEIRSTVKESEIKGNNDIQCWEHCIVLKNLNYVPPKKEHA